MASAWISPRATKDGKRFRVLYRLGGRESVPRYGGSFKTKREALARQGWISGELAAMRVPDLRLVGEETPASLRQLAEFLAGGASRRFRRHGSDLQGGPRAPTSPARRSQRGRNRAA